MQDKSPKYCTECGVMCKYNDRFCWSCANDQFQNESPRKDYLEESKVSKGGVNTRPMTPPPSEPPKGQGVKMVKRGYPCAATGVMHYIEEPADSPSAGDSKI